MESSRRAPTWPVLAAALCAAYPFEAASQLPVVPRAAGHGITTPAGRGGEVIYVTNLEASGAGSLRACLETARPRVCVFEVSGAIELAANLVIRQPNVTVAGQTAPSPGVTVVGAGLVISTHDVLVQHLRFRVGDRFPGPPVNNRDAVGIERGDNVVLDHLSLSWSSDETMSVWYDGGETTVRQCILAFPLDDSIHIDEGDTEPAPHGYGPLLGAFDIQVTMVGNLLAHQFGRNPQSGAAELVWVNNVVYNWAWGSTTIFNDRGVRSSSSLVGNVYRIGADWMRTRPVMVRDMISGSLIYVEDIDAEAYDGVDPWSAVSNSSGAFVVATAPPVWPDGLVALPTAGDAVWDWVLENAGAWPAARDTYDRRAVEETRSGTGTIINCVEADGSARCADNAGGWPVVPENTHDLTPPADPHGDADGDGYTNLEEWLHGFAAAAEGMEACAYSGGVCCAAGSACLGGALADAAGCEGRCCMDGTCEAVASESCEELGGVCCEAVERCEGGRVRSASDCPGRCCVGGACESDPTVFSPVPYLGDRRSYDELTPSRWSVVEDGGDLRYFLNTSSYDGAEGRLGEMAVLRDRVYGDFELSLSARSAESLEENPGPDLCVVFGYEGPADYSYAMLNGDARLTGLYRLRSGVREPLAEGGAAFPIDGAYHAITLVREGTSLVVTVDGLEVLRAEDEMPATGRIGVGSFNDSAYFDDVRVTQPGCADLDGDGFGAPPDDCAEPEADCDDAEPGVYPGAPELCNGRDDDCDGVVDEGFDLDDEQNCGACGNACDPGERCESGTCRAPEPDDGGCSCRSAGRPALPSWASLLLRLVLG